MTFFGGIPWLALVAIAVLGSTALVAVLLVVDQLADKAIGQWLRDTPREDEA